MIHAPYFMSPYYNHKDVANINKYRDHPELELKTVWRQERLLLFVIPMCGFLMLMGWAEKRDESSLIASIYAFQRAFLSCLYFIRLVAFLCLHISTCHRTTRLRVSPMLCVRSSKRHLYESLNVPNFGET